MVNNKEVQAFVVIALVGLFIWLAIVFASGQQDAWDDKAYFGIGIPVMLFTSAIGGFFFPKMPWRWGIAVVCLQPVVGVLVRGKIPRFFIVGLFIFGIVAALCVGTAYLGSAIRRRLDTEDDRYEKRHKPTDSDM